MDTYVIVLALFCFAGAVAWQLPRLRREMALAGVLSLPILTLAASGGRISLPQILWQAVLVVSAGALLDALHYCTLRRLITPSLQPGRMKLKWLALLPVLALLLSLRIPLIVASGISLAVGLVAALIMGGTLVVDALASAVGFGLMYVLLYLATGISVSAGVASRVLADLNVFGHPFGELLLVFAFGALWGPLCAAFRRMHGPAVTNRFSRLHLLPKLSLLGIFAAAIVVSGYWSFDRFVRLPVVQAANLTDGQQVGDLTQPIVVTFNRPIDREVLDVSLTPAVPIEVSFADSYVRRSFVRQVIVTPSQHLEPGTQYSVRLAHVRNVLGDDERETTFTFATLGLPKVASTSVREGQEGVGICEPISVALDQPVNHLAEFAFKLTPESEFATTLGSDKKTYTVKPASCLAQGTKYTLSVERRLTVFDANEKQVNADAPEILTNFSFVTKGAPGIAGFTPQGSGILGDAKKLTVTFSEPMEKAEPGQFITIDPPLPGTWHWIDEKTLEYELTQKVALDTRYGVTIKRGLKDIKNGFLSDDARFSFTTIGHVRVSGISPYSGSGGVRVGTPIKVSFDQPVDHASAEQRFSIVPEVAGTFSWQGQTLVYSTNLSKDTSYTVRMGAGVVSQIGLDLAAGAASTFQTEESVTLLNIPVYYQQKALSCELAALKMALNYKGIGVSEATLLSQIPTDASSRQGNTWGDPNQVFVGDVNGRQNSTGYGVHATPIAALANAYRSAKLISSTDSVSAASLLAQGNPIIFWGTAGAVKSDSWVTPDGRQINTWVGEHVRVLVGFIGSVEHPTGFIINDPIYGRLRWSPSQLRANWGTFGGMGVAIY